MDETERGPRALLLLVGPKGAGKTRLARWLASTLGAEDVAAEATWLAHLRDEPRPTDPEAARAWERTGFERVADRALAALAHHRLVVLDTTGASEHTQAFVERLGTSGLLRIVRVRASLQRCAVRIAARDASEHLPFDPTRLAAVHEASERAALPFVATYDNEGPWDEARVRTFFERVLAPRA